MTAKRYRMVGGTALERDAVIAAAPPECDNDEQGQRVPIILLVPFPGLGLAGESDALLALADIRKHGPLSVVLVGIEHLPGFRQWAGAVSKAAPRAIGVACGGDTGGLRGEEASALLAGQVAHVAARHITSCEPAARGGTLSFAAAVQDARAALAALIDRIAAATPVRAMFLATIGAEPATFARLLRDHRQADETLFLHGVFDDLPESRGDGGSTDAPWRAALVGAALPLLVLAGLTTSLRANMATSQDLSGVALAATRAEAADRSTAYRALAAALERAGDGSRAAAALARAMASSGAVQATVPPLPPPPASVSQMAKESDQATRISYTPPAELYGPLPDAYLKIVLPACETAVGTRYPFVAGITEEVAAGPFRLAFAPGGVFDSFVQKRLAEHIDRSGPVWRWRAGDPAVASFDPDTPDAMARALALGRLAQQGARYSVSLIAVDGDVDGADLSMPGGNVTLKPGGSAQQAYWSLQDQPGEIAVRLTSGGRVVQHIVVGSRWAPMRLTDQGRATPGSGILFGDGLHSATLRFSSDQPIFGRGGLWSFRCPSAL